jgi:hypothetical protein
MVDLKSIIVIIIGIIIIGIIIGGVIEFNAEKEIQWKTSGPFSIQKDEYYLGEKIFLQVNNIPTDVRGEIIFFRPTTDESYENVEEISSKITSKKVKYLGIKFDGENKQNFNRYFEPKLDSTKGTCSVDELVGEWIIVFSGTQYENINFVVIADKMPYDTRPFEPLTGIGNC